MSRLKMKYAASASAIVVLAVGLAISSVFPSSAFAWPVQPHFNRFLSTHYDDDQYSD